jgi:hypothetical protein
MAPTAVDACYTDRQFSFHGFVADFGVRAPFWVLARDHEK